MTRRSYADAFWAGHFAATRMLYIRPFWRGRKYLKAYDNGFRRGRHLTCDCRLREFLGVKRSWECMEALIKLVEKAKLP